MSYEFGYDDKGIEHLIGTKVEKIFFGKQGLRFVTDKGTFNFEVEGDCCSHSEFWDFYGVKNLLNNGEVLSAGSIALDPSDGIVRPHGDDEEYGDVIQYYGYKLTTKDEKFGEVTSVFSFRNTSNGYYGGSMERVSAVNEKLPEITDDVTEAAETGDAYKNSLS